jgi:SAM-dependent methyltransferase
MSPPRRPYFTVVESRSAFAGGDQAYLRDQQYGDTSRLDARSSLHQRFSTSKVTIAQFEAALVDWHHDDRVLECGAGTGRFWTNDATPKSIHLTVTDLSPAMVAAAADSAARNGFTSVTPRECDVQGLPFPSDSFDVVVANHMLYHVPDPDLAISELARVMAPAGVVIVATNGYGHMAALNEAIAAVFGGHAEGLYEVFGIESGEARLRAQFRTIAWHAFDNDLVVTDLDAALAYCLSYPPGEDATPDEAAQLRDALAQRFVDGVLTVRTRAGVFVCRDRRS